MCIPSNIFLLKQKNDSSNNLVKSGMLVLQLHITDLFWQCEGQALA